MRDKIFSILFVLTLFTSIAIADDVSYSITYSCGDAERSVVCTLLSPPPAECSSEPDSVVLGANYTFRSSDICAYEGHTFAGWGCTDGSNNTTTYTSAQTLSPYNVSSNLSCVAQWTTNVTNIDWDPGNGDAHTVNDCSYGGTITLPAEPTKTGYTFNGWVLKEDQSNGALNLLQ